MTPSSRLSARRHTRGFPPVCKSKNVKPYPMHSETGPDEDHKQFIFRHMLPAPPKPPYPQIQLRNLIFFLYPHPENGVVNTHLAMIRDFWHVFNGRKIIAVALDDETMCATDLMCELPEEATIVTYNNNPRLREAVAFLDLLSYIRSTDSHEATFYAHGKGTSPTHKSNSSSGLAIQMWFMRMYAGLLANWERATTELSYNQMVGAYKMDFSRTPDMTLQSPTGALGGQWWFAGTFFWFRHDAIFRNPEWSCVPDDSFATELWPGRLVHTSRALSLVQPFHPAEPPFPELYDAHIHTVPHRHKWD